jgi:hypothetical protein
LLSLDTVRVNKSRKISWMGHAANISKEKYSKSDCITAREEITWT